MVVAIGRALSVHLSDEQPLDVDQARLCDLTRRVLRTQGYPEDAEVAVLLVTDDDMASYNRRFLQREGPTDVLAFPLEEHQPGVPPRVAPSGPPIHLGDVVIAPAYVGRQAAEHGTTTDEEMALMLVHGLLHLMGYDHGEDDEAEAMESREREILAQVGLRRR